MKNTFGERLRIIRKKNDLTQKEMAKELGFSFNQISDWEIGRSIPDIYQLIKIADMFNVCTDYLLGRQDKY